MSVVDISSQADASASLGDYIAGVRRRRKPILWMGGAVLLLAVLVALFWPPTYSTTATILIEEQEIPEDMVRSTITSYANQQIQVIRARVLTLQNIMQIVEKFGLYDKKELARKPRTEIAEDFIDAISLELVNADVIDPRSGRPTEATIAFTLSFKADNPAKALSVTNELVNLFLNENLRTRTEKTSGTSEFLRAEAEKSNKEVRQLEAQIAKYKSEHQESLPESFQLNLQNLTRYQSELLADQDRLRALEKQEADIESKLASMSPYAPVVLPSGEAVLADVDRLKALQSEYRRTAARYSENHPDVIRLRRQIDALILEVGATGDRDELLKLLQSRQDELATLKAQYSEDYPDVQTLEKVIAQLEKQLQGTDDAKPKPAPDNPAYVMLDNQLQSLRMERSSLKSRVTELSSQIEELNNAAAQAPAIEEEYKNLLRNLQVSNARYLDLKTKLKEAELAGELEQGRKGQRFSLVEPPVLPDTPTSPNRLAILFLGVVLAAGAGLGLGLLLELSDASIRNPRRLADLMGVAPLVTVSYISTPAEIEAARPDKKLYLAVAVAIVFGLVMLASIHFFYRPLDVLWFQILRKLGIG